MTTRNCKTGRDDEFLGLYPASDFVVTRGDADDARSLRQALYYFAGETIAVPRRGMPRAGFARGVSADVDVGRWACARPMDAPLQYPPLIWVGSPDMLRSARLVDDGTRISVGARVRPFAVVPRIALNRSYYDPSSVAFLSQRTLTTRGTLGAGPFTARTLWPDDFRLDVAAPVEPVEPGIEAVRGLVRADRSDGGTSRFAARVLWERTPRESRNWEGKPVWATVLNGAQGDDDEAHGGHLALTTGRVGQNGAIGDWLANNFYALDTFSEKGIIAAPVPLDCYLSDLNSGQSWYRPTYIIVAVLRAPRVAERIQGALCRMYNQLYRHQLRYRHATMNCAGISVDALRTLGWRVPSRHGWSAARAFAAFPALAARERSLAKGITAADYLTADPTRLFPAAAFEEIAAAMLQIARGRGPEAATPLEAAFATDVDALLFLRVPQLPSSRAFGRFPVVTTGEYRARMPADPADAQIVPVPPRPFPASLRDPDLRLPPLRPGPLIATGWAALAAAGLAWLGTRLRRRARRG